jgi:hypothetical protein
MPAQQGGGKMRRYMPAAMIKMPTAMPTIARA